MFLQMGLDSPNQIDPVEQIPLCAQRRIPLAIGILAISRAIIGVSVRPLANLLNR